MTKKLLSPISKKSYYAFMRNSSQQLSVRFAFFAFVLFSFSTLLTAQSKSVMIFKNGAAIFSQPVSAIDSIVFVENTIATTRPSKVPGALTDAYLTGIKDGFETRRNKAFTNQLTTPLVKALILPPLSGSTVEYARDYSYSLINYAFKSLWNNADIQAANDALLENTNYYLTHPAYLLDRDSFYWSADEWLRLLEFYGASGTIAPGRISAAVEAKMYELMWLYLNTYKPYAYAESAVSKTWDIDGSENHHAMQMTTFWHFSKLLKANTSYSNRLTTNESKKPYQIYDATTLFLKVFIKERIMKGMLIELANDEYNTHLLKGFYNIFDFSADARLKSLTNMFFDVYWASWAQESILGVRGGGKARIYTGVNSNQGRSQMWKMAYYYLGINAEYQFKDALYTVATSAYRMPLVVMDIALSKAEMGNYEIKDRSLGLAKDGMWYAPSYRIRTDYGGIMRYSYCTPSFIMGTTHVGLYDHQSWTMISDQNRWQGVILDGDPNCRVYPQCKAGTDQRTYNAHWSIQNKGCMITQKLNPPYSLRADTMGVYFSNEGLTNKASSGGWVFYESKGAYVAVSPVTGGCYETMRSDKKWLMCKNPTSPVILQVGNKTEFGTYANFQALVKANPVVYTSTKLTYTSIYGDSFEFFPDLSAMPKVNGSAVLMTPTKVFDSPFMSSTFNSGIITISKNDRSLVVNCNW